MCRVALVACTLLAISGFPQSGKVDALGQATSVIRKEPNRFWLYVHGKETPVFGGVVYRNTQGEMHVLVYSNSLHSLYSPLDEEAVGGSGHA